MKLKNISANRILACLIAVFIFAFSMNFSFDANASNTSRIYRRYNATTGAYLGRYTLNALDVDNNVSTYSLIDTDERVVDFTKSGVVKLILNGPRGTAIASGFVVDSHTIATAGHCIWEPEIGRITKISEIRLFDANGNILKTVIPVESHVPQEFVNNEDQACDYGLITVNEDLSDYAIFDLGVALDSAINAHCTVSVTGFPVNINGTTVNSYTNNVMYTGNGTLTIPSLSDNNRLYYTTDTSGGNSGGPIYVTSSYYGTVYYTVIGIHTRGFNSDDVDQLNSGVRMTTDLLHFYKFNPNI